MPTLNFNNTDIWNAPNGRQKLGIDAIVTDLETQIKTVSKQSGPPGKDGKNGSDGAQGPPGPPGNRTWTTGHGSPEGAVTGSPGDGYGDLDSGVSYTKWTGVATTTGWHVG